MSFRPRVWGVARRALAAVLATFIFLGDADLVRADTTFGSDPNQPVTALSCAAGAPTVPLLPPFLGTEGSQSCLWTWNNPAVGTDIVPFPVTGGSGTITSVTLPAMSAPGPMAVVVLGAALSSSGDPSRPQSICCQVKQIGPTFTVPAGQVTTVPQALRVSATEAANPYVRGDTSFGDLLGIAVLSPGASLPIRYTGATGLPDFDGSYAYYPVPPAGGEYLTPYDPAGFQLLARFTLAPDTPGGGPTAPAAPPAATPQGPAAGARPGAGLRLRSGLLRPAADGRTLTLGKATNPPTARSIQTLRLPIPKAAGAARAGGSRKLLVIGRGKTTVPGGRSAGLKLSLNRKGLKLLGSRGSLKAKLTIVATNADGESQQVNRVVKLGPTQKAPKKKPSRSGRVS